MALIKQILLLLLADYIARRPVEDDHARAKELYAKLEGSAVRGGDKEDEEHESSKKK